ncbi:MAG: adenosine monophosphate-protein transferase [Candidatus Diapherotrites archaeon]|nr:adenosine monophosphate-protein transferase [Candidatus Diapherotrites archaeon]
MQGIEARRVTIPDCAECIIGQGNFSLKTVDDIARTVMASANDVKVGVAMNDGSTKLTRVSGNDDALEKAAGDAAFSLGAGHAFVVFISGAFPIHVLNDLNNVHGVCNIYAASSNPLLVVVATSEQGNAVLGVVDGFAPERLEGSEDKAARKGLMERIGFKLG